MNKLLVRGGNTLMGRIEVSGAKNASLPIMMASILIDGTTTLFNIPSVSDITTSIELLTHLGTKININNNYVDNKKVFIIDTTNINSFTAPYEIVSKMRASFWVLGSLLGRFGEAKVSLPGGCAIGARPSDIYIDALSKMDVDIEIENGYVIAKARNGKLKGADITLRLPSVGATHNTIMASVLADGKTIIRNAAKEPEIVDLANFLITAGAKINGAGTDTIEIEGVEKLHSTQYKVIGDRIEAFTYMIATAITGGDVILDGLDFFAVLEKPINTLIEIGVGIETLSYDKIRVFVDNNLKPIHITTDFYPGFPTDCQASVMALLGLVDGESTVDETIYENRFMHVPELNRLAANININGNKAIIKGVKRYSGANVMSSDLRAGMALVLAGLQAEGETIIDRIYHIERGYENFVEKLRNCGADLEIITD